MFAVCCGVPFLVGLTMSDEQREQLARDSAVREESANRRRVEAAAERVESERQQENEQDFKGLVLLKNTLRGGNDDFGCTITGTIVNRRRKKVDYVQISVSLYDSNGRHVGTALDNTLGLESGTSWRFTARGVERFATFKVNEIQGY